MSEKSKKILKVVILGFVVMAICLGGIVTIDLLMPNDKTESNPSSTNSPSSTESPLPIPNEPEIEEKEISMELAEELIKVVGLVSTFKYDKTTPNIFSNDDKNTIIAGVLFERDYKDGIRQLIYTEEEILQAKNNFFLVRIPHLKS